MAKWISHAQWPLDVYRGMDGSGISTDEHWTWEDAQFTCKILSREGFGGQREHFPLRTWVTEALNSMPVPDEAHYCKHCRTWFRIDIGQRASGDFILKCPECGWGHYRHFALGEAIHCDIKRRHEDPRTIQGCRL